MEKERRKETKLNSHLHRNAITKIHGTTYCHKENHPSHNCFFLMLIIKNFFIVYYFYNRLFMFFSLISV